MTIEKATTITQQTNIKSWCQKVLDLQDLLFADPLDLDYQIYLGLSKYLDGNSDKHNFSFKQGRKISGFLWNIQDISRNPSHANSETKKF